MIADLHSHILPGIDDGSASVSESLALLRLAREQGIRHVAATPHFYAHRDDPQAFLDRRARALDQLLRETAKEPDLPEIFLGAEVYYFLGMSESDALHSLSYDGGTAILVEMPMSPWSPQMYEELRQIWKRQGLIPVIAHVDRYIAPLRTHRIPEKLEELPVLVQANASFFQRASTSAMAKRMLKKGQIHVLGSDCHNMDFRKPNLGQTIELIERGLGREALEQIAENQKHILNLP